MNNFDDSVVDSSYIAFLGNFEQKIWLKEVVNLF